MVVSDIQVCYNNCVTVTYLPCPLLYFPTTELTMRFHLARLCLGSGFALLLGLGLTFAMDPLAEAAWHNTKATLPLHADAKLDFNRDIRPILTDKCFACHGPDSKQLKGKLRLDQKESVFRKDRKGGPVIVPGQPEASLLYQRIMTPDETERMPPDSTHKPLTDAEKTRLKQWIAQGAEYQSHWAFNPPRRPELPSVKNQAWPRNEIDRFILASLEDKGWSVSPEADKTTLLRRLSLDLTGLPPTTAELDAFLQDTSPQAYEKQVDRLLASPHYGERMAMKWLDLARYADSNGYQADYERFMWRWRDWVIDAYNQNMPFDQFTIEQLAGDLLPNPTMNQRLATGFNRNHRINTEGGVIAEEWRVETVIDRVETTSLTWMGLTMGCARCHDHKYDPITMKDFYSFFAFFNNVPESGSGVEMPVNHPPLMQAPQPSQVKPWAKLKEQVQASERSVRELEKELPKLLAAWLPGFTAQMQTKETPWHVVQPSNVVSKGGATLTALPDGSILAGGTNPTFDVYTLTIPVEWPTIAAFRLEALMHESMPQGSVGRYPNGNFVLSGFEAEFITPGATKPLPLQFKRAEAEYSQQDWSIDFVLKKVPRKGWAIDGHVPQVRQPRQAWFYLAEPQPIPAGSTLIVYLKQEALDQHNLGRFRLSVTEQIDKEPAIPLAVRLALQTDEGKRSETQKQAITNYFRQNHAGPLTEADRSLDKHRKALSEFEKTIPSVMIMEEMPQPRDCFVLERGQYNKHGAKVTAQLPSFLPPIPAGQPMNRLGLARWLVQPEHPLTARVLVNRLWEKFFGQGIVRTSENFGMQSEYPSHPELLDWLATEIVRRQWDLKALQKTIVMSATYRQSSKATPEQMERDPENRWLARGPRFRLPAELIRDQALAISGLLVANVGGPSVRPYQPAGVWDETNVYGNLRNYKHDKGDGLYRRSMYTIWKRTAAPPTMLLFDAPSREFCTVKRSRTNTPLQALALLNEITFVETARVLAERMLTEGGHTDAERLRYGFRRATSRWPTQAELTILEKGLQQRLTRYQKDPEAAKRLIQQGDTIANPKLDPVQLASYTMTASVLLNLDEVVTKE